LEALNDVRAAKPNPELEARQSRLRDDKLGGATPNVVADTDAVFEKTLSSEVLAKRSPGKVGIGKLCPPKDVVLRWIGVDSLVSSTVNGKIGLLIAFEVELLDPNRPRDRRLEDGRPNYLASPLHLARQTHIDR
jgi:hypothetical protein